jgi:hypothetical protein
MGLNMMRFSTRGRLAALLLAAGAFGGCSRTPTAQELAEKAYADNPRYKRVQTAKFSGHVTIDGQPPAKEASLSVLLNDPTHLDAYSNKHPPELRIGCDENGRFAFTTLFKEDGVPVGKYVVTFLCLHPTRPPLKTRFISNRRTRPRFQVGTDDLHNLYNDPEKNAEIPEFNLDLQPPGKDDYEFDLTVAGRDEGTPGPHAITR